PVWGKLGDTIGRKKVYMLGFGLFIFGSVLAGFAWNFTSMIVFRIIQAIASSADYPTAMAIVATTFKNNKRRAQALGIWSSAFAASAIMGPLLGGPLIDNFGWRSIFFLNLPVGIVGMLMASVFIRESVVPKIKPSFDWWGAITLGISLSSLVLVLDKVTDWGWLSLESIACYVSALAFGAIFVAIERHIDEPMVDLKFFKIPVFVNVLVNNFIVFMGMMGSVFLIPIFAQTFLGYDATQSGYLFIPMAVAMMVVAPFGGALTGKVRAGYVIAASTFVAAIGLFLFSVYLDPRSGALDIIIPLTIMAIGLGFGMPQRTNIIASTVPEREVGVASSILALARNIAGAFGISLSSTFLVWAGENNAIEIAKNSIINSTNPIIHSQFVQLIELKAQIDAYGSVFLISAGLVLLGAILALFIKVPHEKIVTVHMES
ncbi:MAG TPA: DHA2 family efflux MFS transporter permease subunit, partial [Candidatus Paceibacterota bacterium]|nr:DHA2 family efflux MFS transporter permease subunit [Candidatus Paceibacterota bacterium]